MARLGDIFTISSGGTPDKRQAKYYENGTIPWVKTGDLKEKYVSHNIERITQEGLDNSSAKLFPADTVLVAMYGATIGACSILGFEASTNQACAAFLPTSKVLPDYLYYFLQSKKDIFVQSSVGGAQPNISAGYLKRFPFDIIPVESQRKIISALDSVSTLISLRKQQLAKLDELVKVRFVEMFGDLTINSKGLKIVHLSEVAEYFNGLTYKPENVSDIGTIVLRSSNIQDNQLDFADTVRVNCQIKERLFVRENDILMCSRNGSARLVGKVALIRELNEPMSFGAFMMIIRSKYYPYLVIYFQNNDFRRQIKTGATTTINQITGRMLDEVVLPVPELKNMAAFESFMEKIFRQKLTIQQSLDKLEVLRKSLMQEYFG